MILDRHYVDILHADRSEPPLPLPKPPVCMPNALLQRNVFKARLGPSLGLFAEQPLLGTDRLLANREVMNMV